MPNSAGASPAARTPRSGFAGHPRRGEQITTWSGYAKGQATIELPEGAKPDEAKLELTFAPSLAADLVDTLNYLVEYPYGCVEQTMSRFLPAVNVAQVLKKKKIDNEALLKKLPGAVESGISASRTPATGRRLGLERFEPDPAR
jgi:uncharacterized protein YfaS (alpha-2-macroglobulin family)